MDLPTFITFMVMFMLLFFGMLAIFLAYRHSRHLVDLNHRERMTALERGLEIPPPTAIGGGPREDTRPAHYLHRGLIFTLLGLSLMAALGVNAGAKSALWGLPVTAFGIAYLILFAVAENQRKKK
ncbi:MAG: hypothetical protein ABW106_16495 [Steroidobacteraceae bacterium]